jgi:hypothetical protein
MTPEALTAASFSSYPPEAKQLASTHLGLLRQLPLAFLPLLLREVIAYDWKFPAERKELDHQFEYLEALSPQQLAQSMRSFADLKLSPKLESLDWVGAPGIFSEQLTAHLWATHQVEAFRTASVDYVHKLNAAKKPVDLPAPRLAIVFVGHGVEANTYPLFKKLRPRGVYFSNLDPTDGRASLFEALRQRAAAHPEPYAHWYIDGAVAAPVSRDVTSISYAALDPIRKSLVNKMRLVMGPGGGGPEVLRTMLAQMRPDELGFDSSEKPVLSRFEVSLLTEGSGTQLFSTTFVQWSAREVLRRAQPLTLLARFTPRQHEQSMRELLAGASTEAVLDPHGALIDADMGAYYTWINLQRLPGADKSCFLVWFENHREGVLIAPSLQAGTEDKRPLRVASLLELTARA